jgi:hypothetical protein
MSVFDALQANEPGPCRAVAYLRRGAGGLLCAAMTCGESDAAAYPRDAGSRAGRSPVLIHVS